MLYILGVMGVLLIDDLKVWFVERFPIRFGRPFFLLQRYVLCIPVRQSWALRLYDG